MSEELPALATMSFSATILFSPPGGSGGGETRCCCCACKSETSGGSTGCQGGNPPSSTPITVTGHGLAVQSSEQLLHIIYQRVEKAVGLAEAALGLARANNELLKHLQEEVGELRQWERGVLLPWTGPRRGQSRWIQNVGGCWPSTEEEHFSS